MTSESKEVHISYYELTPEDAIKLSNYLPVRMRDFWFGLHPMIQAKLFMYSHDGMEFFSLVDQEFARFGQGARFPKSENDSWAGIKPILSTRYMPNIIMVARADNKEDLE